MLRYSLKSSKSGKLIYYYYPEGNMNSPGVVIFYLNGDKEVARESEDDVKKIYAFHALSGIDKKKKTGTVAWY